jgi:two-component system chemotaxis sensor kinase CheA
VRRGLKRRGTDLAPDAGADAVIRELLRGGLSTSATVTEVAGRGIGLDLVRDTAHRLGGEVTATTVAGVGATFVLTVPVSLHAMTVVTVAAGAGRAAIPRDSVRSTRVHRDADLVHRGGARALAIDGALLPYASIGAVLGDRSAAGQTRSVIVVAHPTGDVALGVDRVIGVDDVIARARPRAAPIRRIVAALSVDPEARPTPILDPDELAARIRAVAAAPATAATDPAGPALAPILVVDDSLTTRMLEQSILESAGYAVELAGSAEEALDKVLRTRYALVLVDVEMPGMDGFAFVSELRARPAVASLPAILVTSRNAAEDRRRGAAAGAQDYIVKGEFDQTFLLRRIRELVG